MILKKSIKKLCEEYEKSELLDEIIFSEYTGIKSKRTFVNPSATLLYWKCHTVDCNNTFKMTLSKRLKIDDSDALCKKCKSKILRIQMSQREGTKSEIHDLCKLLQTSLPEQYIYAYIKRLFPNAINSKNLIGLVLQNLIFLSLN